MFAECALRENGTQIETETNRRSRTNETELRSCTFEDSTESAADSSRAQKMLDNGALIAKSASIQADADNLMIVYVLILWFSPKSM